MKISSAVYNENYGKKPSESKAILPLVPEKAEKVSSSQTITHTLRSTPTDADSPKYKVVINILQGDEDCRSIINWRKDAQKILTGLAVTTHNPALAILDTLMAETPRALFTDGVQKAKTANWEARVLGAADEGTADAIHAEGVEHANNINFDQIEDGLKHVVKQLLPRRVLARAKRFIRRDCRKPAGMKV